MIGSRRRRLSEAAIGELIRDVRLEAGLTQTQLADRLSTKQSVVSRWERGHDVPRADSLAAILRACGWEADVVLRPSDSGVDRAQIRAMLRRSPEERLNEAQAMHDFVRRMRDAS